jgi:uncharacterized protein
MRFTFDPAKNEKNIAERGLSFALAAELDWEAAFIVEDTRHDYGDLACVFWLSCMAAFTPSFVTPRKDELRVISFRKANRKEEKLYDQHSKT